jgi:hypothetical protein
MKAIYISVIKSIFDMFIECRRKVSSLSRTDKPWQEWLIFVLFMALTFAVVWFGFAVSIDIMTGSSDIIPEVIH